MWSWYPGFNEVWACGCCEEGVLIIWSGTEYIIDNCLKSNVIVMHNVHILLFQERLHSDELDPKCFCFLFALMYGLRQNTRS